MLYFKASSSKGPTHPANVLYHLNKQSFLLQHVVSILLNTMKIDSILIIDIYFLSFSSAGN